MLDPAVLDEVVEGGAALEVLQPVDDGEAAIVADDDDHLVAGQHRGIDVGIHHQIGAVAGKDDDITVRIGHRRAPAAGDLVAHAGKAEFAIKRARRLDLPDLGKLARQAAGGGQDEVGVVAGAVDDADDLRIGRHRHIGGLCDVGDRFAPFGIFVPAGLCPGGVGLPAG